MLWSGLIAFIHVLGEIANGLIAAASGACIIMVMSDLTHRSHACKPHLNMQIENALLPFYGNASSVSHDRSVDS